MSGVLPAIYAGSLWLKHGRVVGHYSGYEDWLEVREHVEHGFEAPDVGYARTTMTIEQPDKADVHPDRRIEWECGCITEGTRWNRSYCTGATHGCGSGTPCTSSPLDHSAYKALRESIHASVDNELRASAEHFVESAERMIRRHLPLLEKLAEPDTPGLRVRATSRMRISYVIDPVELYMRTCGAEAVVQSAATEIFRKLAKEFGPITGELVLTLETKEK